MTAASRGIGRACALVLAREGAHVAMCAREAKELCSAADFIRAETGARVVAHPADVTRTSDIENLIARAKQEFGKIDILVAIGGSPPRGSFAELSEEQFRQAFDMTVLALVRLISGVFADMRKNGWGRIIAVQARSVREPIAALTLSNATRPGAAGLIKDLSLEGARHGVLMNTVLPGRIMTDRLRGAAEQFSQSADEFFKAQTSDLPIGRLGKPEEIADAVAFLASERSSYIAGATLAVDGGLIRSI